MTARRMVCCVAVALLAWHWSALDTAAQDTLARAKDLYVQANYDEALVVLARLRATAPASESSEVAGYQVLCLLAVGRKDEAVKAIEALVKADPMYQPSASTVSPRTRATFDAVRQALLPEIVQGMYDKAKAAFDRKELSVAEAEFNRVLTVLDEPGIADLQNMADLRRLAGGFRDLSKAATEIAPASPAVRRANGTDTPVAPSPAPAPSAPAPEAPRIYGGTDEDVTPPTSVSRRMPVWLPRNEIEKRQDFQGVVVLVIDETGAVTSVAMSKSVHPVYDRELLDFARTWKFRPATRVGVPVKYRMAIEVRLNPDRR
jgi:TonB family protein